MVPKNLLMTNSKEANEARVRDKHLLMPIPEGWLRKIEFERELQRTKAAKIDARLRRPSDAERHAAAQLFHIDERRARIEQEARKSEEKWKSFIDVLNPDLPESEGIECPSLDIC